MEELKRKIEENLTAMHEAKLGLMRETENVIKLRAAEMQAKSAARLGIVAGTDKKPTESIIDAQVELDPDVIAARLSLQAAQSIANRYQIEIDMAQCRHDAYLEMLGAFAATTIADGYGKISMTLDRSTKTAPNIAAAKGANNE